MKACGKLFGDAVAKIGVDGLLFALSMFGLKKASARLTTRTVVNNGLNSRKWQGKIIKERKLRLGDGEVTNSGDLSAPSKAPPARTTIINKPVKAYKTEAQITEYIKTLKVDSAQQTKLMTELAHDPKNLKRFLNRYGEEAESLIKRHGYPPKYWKSRPSYKEGQVETVWENAKKDPAKTFFEKDGIEYIRDRKGTVSWNKDIPRNGQWDMGHLKDQKYSDMYDFFIRGDISEQEFLKLEPQKITNRSFPATIED